MQIDSHTTLHIITLLFGITSASLTFIAYNKIIYKDFKKITLYYLIAICFFILSHFAENKIHTTGTQIQIFELTYTLSAILGYTLIIAGSWKLLNWLKTNSFRGTK